MAKKAFLMILLFLVVTFAFGAVLRYGRPSPGHRVDITAFPLTKGEWTAQTLPIDKGVIAMLNPDAIFNALYADPQGTRIDLFFSYFAGDNAESGVHSPRNCMPGGGWTIEKTENHGIPFNGGMIPASRMHVRLEDDKRVVDYWYITRNGETSSDLSLKLFTMLGAVSFQPTDVAFVRFISPNDPVSLAQLQAFESEFIGEIYRILPFDSPTATR